MIPPENSEVEKTINFSVRGFKDALHKRLKIEAVRRGLSMGDLLNLIIEEWLKQNEGEE